MILMIDNYDSFTYNVAQYLREMAAEVEVARNDAIDIAGIRAIAPQAIVISPGPGRPESAGVSMDAIKEFAGKIPVFGICLGHQVLGQAFGGKTGQRLLRPVVLFVDRGTMDQAAEGQAILAREVGYVAGVDGEEHLRVGVPHQPGDPLRVLT